MTINTIEERVTVIEKLWKRTSNKKVCNILLQQLTNDIVFFLGEKLPEELEQRIDQLDEEINHANN